MKLKPEEIVANSKKLGYYKEYVAVYEELQRLGQEIKKASGHQAIVAAQKAYHTYRTESRTRLKELLNVKKN